ncbi:MAG: hypothetical protein A2W23_00525, partial [Planctomycetes bacterium RBG_16_43_13]
MLTVAQASELIFKDVPPREVVTLPLADSLACVLAEDVSSDINMPPFDKSAMDGYAVIASDTAKTPATLEIVEELPAGKFPTKTVAKGQCAKIMTGAPIPKGADAVVMVEKTEAIGANKVKILSSAKVGQNICEFAEDLKEGEVVLKSGSLIRPQEIGVLAAVGRAEVRVYKKPHVAVISTGDELVEVAEKPTKGQIRNSNSYSVSAQVLAMGLECDNLGVARDTKGEIRHKIAEGLERDVLIISGGVSVGEYDFVTEALAAEGVECVMHQVAIKPGRPFYFGKKGVKRVFALPGNPASTFVIFEVFVRPFLGLMYGNNACGRPILRAEMKVAFTKTSDRVQYIPGKIIYDSETARYFVEPIFWHGSADIFALTRADCLIIIPPNSAVA